MRLELEQAIAAVIKTLFDVELSVVLTRPDEQFGDYATNVALQFAKQVGQNPRDLAQALATEIIKALPTQVTEVIVAGPGFLNLRLSKSTLVKCLEFAPERSREGQKVLVEYSDPNPLKPLHAGHLYTTLVGDSIARLLEVAGADVVRLNYGGDVGLHVAKSMWGILQELGGEQPEKLAAVPEADRPGWLGARYVLGNNAYEDDEAAKAEVVAINKRVYEVQANDDHVTPLSQIYWTVRQWSYDYFSVLYQQLQVTPFDRYIPESEVTQLGISTVREQLAKGIYQESEGAVVFEGEPFGLHTRVFINSAGLPTYEAKDVGLILTKWHDYNFSESIVITANEQAQYYEVMLKSVEQFAPEIAARSKHLTHGVVKLQGGVKMSSRKGNIVSALDIIDAARLAGQQTGREPSEETTLAAIKYAFAKNRLGGDIAYDPLESIALEGNSGPYLQYAHARACSIMAKAELGAATLENLEPAERSLLLKITEYTEIVDKSVTELMPHHICTYLYELAQKFNAFYEHNRVIDDPRQAIRLRLVRCYADTLKRGLTLLGIIAPERM